MAGFTLDTGALIALEHRDRATDALLRTALKRKARIVVPAGVVAQAWRNPRRQVELVRFLASEGIQVEPLDSRRAKEAGQLCGLTGTKDVIDAAVVVCARAHKHAIVTSDPDDLRRLDPNIELIEV